MKLAKILACAILFCACASVAGATSLDFSLNDRSLQGQVFLPLTQDAYGTTLLGMRGLYNDHHETKLVSGELDFLGKPGDVPGLTIGAGLIAWGGEVGKGDNPADLFSVGIGARAGYAPPQFMGLGIDGKLFYGPKILTAGDSERFIESALRLSYAFIPKARCFVEYQNIHVDFDGGDGNVDSDLRIGFEAKF